MNKSDEKTELEQAAWPRWTVTFSVSPLWIQDGFDLTEQVAKDMIEKALPLSYTAESRVRIDKAPLASWLKGLRV